MIIYVAKDGTAFLPIAGGGGGKSGGGGASAPPPPPDPAETARAQAQANRITQITPTGNIVFGTLSPDFNPTQLSSGDPSVPFPGFVPNIGTEAAPKDAQAALQVVETPTQRAVREQLEPGAINLASLGRGITETLPNTPLTFDGLPGLRSELDFSQVGAVPGSESFADTAQQLEQATFDRAFNLLEPELRFQEDALDQRLADRGLPGGSEGFDLETGRFDRQKATLLNDLALASVGAGRAEQSRLFDQALTSRNAQLQDQLQSIQLGNLGRATGFTERQATRGQQFNELAALLGLNQVSTPGIGQFVPPGAVDVIGPQQLALSRDIAASNAANQNAAISAGRTGSLLGAGASLGGSALLASAIKSHSSLKDRHGEVDSKSILMRLLGMKIEVWNYKGEKQKHIGPMADDFAEIFGVGDGFHLNLVDVVGVLLASIKGLAEILLGGEYAKS